MREGKFCAKVQRIIDNKAKKDINLQKISCVKDCQTSIFLSKNRYFCISINKK